MSDWRDEAACLEEDPELFFPIGNTGPAVRQIEDAKAVCRRCEVAGTCLRWALDTGQDAGVWGGLSEDERRALKRRNARVRRAGGEPAPAVPARARQVVPAGPTRQIMEAARRAGYSRQAIATRIGCGDDVVRKVLAGQENVLPTTEVAAREADFPGSLVNAGV